MTFSQPTDGTYSGAMSGSGRLIKYWPGTLTGSNIFSGQTTIGNGAISVGDGGTSGSLASAVALSSLTSLIFNRSDASTYAGNISGTSMQWELFANGDSNVGTTVFDQVLVSGNLNFSTSTAFSLAFDGAGSTVDWADAFWSTNEQWTIWQAGGATTGIGNLSLTSSDWLDANGQSLSTSLSGANFSLGLGANGKDVVLFYVAPVPEPSTWAMLVTGAALAAWRARRRRGISSGTPTAAR